MRKTTLCLFIFYLFLSSLSAQEKIKFRIGLEAGGASTNGLINERWNIRQDLRHYSASSITVSESLYYTYLGAKTEFSFFKDKFSLLSGLRFSGLTAEMNDNGQKDNSNDFFFLRQRDTKEINFYTVYSVVQEVNFVSIPLELSYIPFRFKGFALYAKLGSEFGMKISEKTKINFTEKSMSQYEKEVLDEIGAKTNSFYSTVYAALGTQYQSSRGIRYNFEVLLASRQLTTNNNIVIEPGIFNGIQFSILLPLSFKKEDKSQ